MQLFNEVVLKDVGYKTYRGIRIIPKKEFNKYKKKCNAEGVFLTVMYNFEFKEIKWYETQDYANVIKVNNMYYELTQEKEKSTAGFIAIAEDKFIRVTQKRLLLFILLLILCLLLALSTYLMTYDIHDEIMGDTPTTNIPLEDTDNKPDIKVDDSAVDYTGNIVTPEDPMITQNITLPGFHKFTATSTQHSVQLWNPEENDVYFQYSIYEILGEEKVGTFDSREKAMDWIYDNKVNYIQSNEDGFRMYNADTGEEISSVKNYDLNKISEEEFEVVAEEWKLIYLTNMIEPGKQVLWNAYETLGTGEFKLKFSITPFDIEDGTVCDGARYPVTGIIKN